MAIACDPFLVYLTPNEYAFPHIYEPFSGSERNGIPPMYGLLVKASKLQPVIEDQTYQHLYKKQLCLPNDEFPSPYFKVNSKSRREVYVLDHTGQRNTPVVLKSLMETLQVFDARNVSRDNLFTGRGLWLSAKPYVFKRFGLEYAALSLLSVGLEYAR